MKVKLSKLQNSVISLNALAGTKPNFKTSYDIARRIKAISSELELFEKTRVEKVKELSGNVIENNQYVLGDNKEKFENEIKELLEHEVDLKIEPLKYEELAKLDIVIEPAHLMNLDFLISDEQVSAPTCEHKE